MRRSQPGCLLYLRPGLQTNHLDDRRNRHHALSILSHHFAPVLGAGKLASETSPLPNATITYGYDALGRPYRFDQRVAATKTLTSRGAAPVKPTPWGSSVTAMSRFVTAGVRAFSQRGDGAWTYLPTPRTTTSSRSPMRRAPRPFPPSFRPRFPANRITTWSQQAGAGA